MSADPEAVLTAAARMAFALDVERGNDRSPAQDGAVDASEVLEQSGIRRVENLLDGEMTRRVLTLTPQMWRELSPHQRRAMLDWTVRRAKLFEERSAFMSRNLAAGELEIPAALRAAL